MIELKICKICQIEYAAFQVIKPDGEVKYYCPECFEDYMDFDFSPDDKIIEID